MDKPISTSLLRTVAEAARSHRTGLPVYVVVRRDYPHEREVFHSDNGGVSAEIEAKKFYDSCPPQDDWVMLGPYVTEREGEASDWGPANFSVTVEVTSPSGEKWNHTLDPRTDAVFFSLAAIDKFAIPYYTHIHGVERAAELRRQVLAKPAVWEHVGNTAWLNSSGGGK